MMRIRVAWFLPLLCVAAGTAFGGTSLSLDGEWRLDYFPEPDRAPIRALPLAVPVKTVTATVPGNCELDLVRAGVLPEPEKGLNVLALRPYEAYQWLYTRSFTAPEVPEGGRAVLAFGGIDTLADVFLNGERIGESDNMLVPRRFDVTDRLLPGSNVVQVLIRSAVLDARNRTVGELGYSMGPCGLADGEPYRKAGYMGGWDIFPRVFCAGLWRSVSLEVEGSCRIDNVAWISGDGDRDGSVRIDALCRVRAPFGRYGRADLRFRLSRDGRIVAEKVRPFNGAQNAVREWRVSGLERWWPKGMGESVLYDATIELLSKEDGTVLARDARRVGIRSIRLERRDAKGSDTGEFVFRVNGEKCYVRGVNWVPLDAFPSRCAGRLTETLAMVEDLNCNMIRVWGGGIYESDAFYDWCDEHGVMVWQDFMTGCSAFPQTDEFARAIRKEALVEVLRLRNHAALTLWSGNNENDCTFAWLLGDEHARDPNRDRLSRQVLPDVVFEHDVMHDYLPSSPYISPEVFAGRATMPEQHLWGVRGYYKVPAYTNSPAKFASEMGYHGCPGRGSLERMMTAQCVHPWTDAAKKTWNDEWLLKASNPYLDRTSYLMDRNNLMTRQVRLMFGAVPDVLDDFILASQIVQSEAMKTFIELFRSRKFNGKNGLIWWNLRDGWPQISDAVVDYYGERKRAYRAIRAAQRDQLVMVRDDHQIVAVNDTLKDVGGSVRITDRTGGRVVFEKTYSVPANAAVTIGTVTWSGQGVLSIEGEQGGATISNWFLYGEPPFDLHEIARLLP